MKIKINQIKDIYKPFKANKVYAKVPNTARDYDNGPVFINVVNKIT